ncbi:MAG: hypothetical protein KC729_15940, partial [Candidatus Eisenbacteria bacterium]|nr:hypothetical protein [Candidatus Eisenbacteria bacterium]
MTRKTLFFAMVVLLAGGCGVGERPASENPSEAGAETVPVSEEYRNVRTLGEGVYTYEFAPVGDPVTTVSLFVVTPDGVVVADGQGSPAETEHLLA